MLVVKKPASQSRRRKRREFNPWVGKIPWRRAWQPILVFLPGVSHEQRNLVGYSPWGRKKSSMTEWLSTAHCYNEKWYNQNSPICNQYFIIEATFLKVCSALILFLFLKITFIKNYFFPWTGKWRICKLTVCKLVVGYLMEHSKKQMKQFDCLITISSYASFKAIIAVRTYPTIQTVFLLVQIYNHYVI